MQLISILLPGSVYPHIDVDSKKRAMRLLAANASEITGIGEKDIFNTLMERELHGSTGMGSGVAIPHGRFEELTAAHAFFATLKKPVEFGSADLRPVDLIFMLLTPLQSNNDHLKALALASRLLRDKAMCEKLRTTLNPTSLYLLLTSQGSEE